jgi:hypothetical protein
MVNSLRKKSGFAITLIDSEIRAVLDQEDHHKVKEHKVIDRYLSQEQPTESQTTRLVSLAIEGTLLKQPRLLVKNSTKKRLNILKDSKVITFEFITD